MSRVLRRTPAESPLTDDRRRILAKAAARPDAEIDFSDVPPLTEEFWAKAVRNPFYRSEKQLLTVRLDTDIALWLRQQGKGYQTRLNDLLREAMQADLAKRG